MVLGCQFSRSQNALDIAAEDFERLDQKFGAAGVSEEEVRNIDRQLGLRKVQFEDLDDCNCSKGQTCMGTKWTNLGEPGEHRRLILVPQDDEKGYADSYVYTPPLKAESEIRVNTTKINRALRYANLPPSHAHSGLNLMAPLITSRLRYRGNDPAIVLEMEPHEDADTVGCHGGPQHNMIDAANRKFVFSNVSMVSAMKDSKDHMQLRPYWTWTHRQRRPREHFVSVACRATVDASGSLMGTVCLDFNMSKIVDFIDHWGVTPSSYAGIVDIESGRFLMLSQRGRHQLFDEEMDLKTLLEGRVPCSPEDWTCRSNNGLSLKDLPDASKRNHLFGMLAELKTAGTTMCSSGSISSRAPIDFGGGKEHIIAYCQLNSVPSWAFIAGSSLKDVAETAVMELSDTKIYEDHVDYTSDKGGVEHFNTTNKERTITLTNNGTVPLKYTVASRLEPPAQLTVHPKEGILDPYSTVDLTVSFKLEGLSKGTYTGSILVQPSAGDFEVAGKKRNTGSCFRQHPAITVHVNVMTPSEAFVKQWLLVMKFAAVLAILVFLFSCSAFSIRQRLRAVGKQYETLRQAKESVSTMSHPMVLMALSIFKAGGALMKHEDAQQRHELLWLYSLNEVEDLRISSFIVFMSHQWTAWSTPDPTNVQFNAMLMSLVKLCSVKSWDEADVYVWADYTSIPQVHKGLQQLAINSLPWYAAKVAAFVIVAPQVQHNDIEVLCDKATYSRRAWCRAEQLAHLLANGKDAMYLAEGGELNPVTDDWLETSIMVFDGELTCCTRKHVGMERCDKQSLMIPMLGLWDGLCRSKHNPIFAELHAQMSSKLESIFPKDFVFETPKGKVKKELFGNLLSLMETNDEDEENNNAVGSRMTTLLGGKGQKSALAGLSALRGNV
jgi:hypothetical protein